MFSRIKKMSILILLGLFLYPIGLRAQPELSGFLQTDGYLFTADSLRFAKQINELRMQVNARHARIGLTASADIYTTSAGVQTDLWEGYIDYYGTFYDLRLGKQVVSWGTTDGINPTDNLNPFDLGRKSPFVDPAEKKLPVTMAKADLYFGGLRLTGIFVPDFHPFRLPDTSTWHMSRPDDLLKLPPNTVIQTKEAPVPPVEPDDSPENAEYALKLSGDLAGINLSVSYFHGWDDFPSFHPKVTPQSVDQSGTRYVNVQPTLKYHQVDVFGGDFATSLFGLGLRGEAAYYLTEDEDGTDPFIQNPFLHYVLGLDYTFRNGLYLNGQFVSGMFKRYGLTPTGDEDYMITSALTYDLNDYNSFEVGGMYSITDENLLLKPSYTRTLSGGVDLTLGAYIVQGETGSHFGAFRSNDQIYGQLRYNF